jgi:hypothetical protein
LYSSTKNEKKIRKRQKNKQETKKAFDDITGVNIYSDEPIENTQDLVSIYPELVKEAASLKSKTNN